MCDFTVTDAILNDSHSLELYKKEEKLFFYYFFFCAFLHLSLHSLIKRKVNQQCSINFLGSILFCFYFFLSLFLLFLISCCSIFQLFFCHMSVINAKQSATLFRHIERYDCMITVNCILFLLFFFICLFIVSFDWGGTIANRMEF